jgi:methionyl-tRNA synthetase
VWFDALINYLSATGFPDPGYERFWPADLHVIGKGISRLHCALWPAMLLSAGLPVQRKVWAHGYVQWGGAKVSKSEGGAVSLDSAIDRHGPDALRYFLLREVGFEADGNFTWERFEERYAADLADGLGNLVSRSLAMIARYRDGVVPQGPPAPLDSEGTRAVAAYEAAMDRLDLRGGAEAVWSLVSAANLYIQRTAPWTLAKEHRDAELDAALATLARTLWRLAVLATPFVPGKAQLIWAALGCSGRAAAAPWSALAAPPTGGRTVESPGVLFPKLVPA